MAKKHSREPEAVADLLLQARRASTWTLGSDLMSRATLQISDWAIKEAETVDKMRVELERLERELEKQYLVIKDLKGAEPVWKNWQRWDGVRWCPITDEDTERLNGKCYWIKLAGKPSTDVPEEEGLDKMPTKRWLKGQIETAIRRIEERINRKILGLSEPATPFPAIAGPDITIKELGEENAALRRALETAQKDTRAVTLQDLLEMFPDNGIWPETRAKFKRLLEVKPDVPKPV